MRGIRGPRYRSKSVIVPSATIAEGARPGEEAIEVSPVILDVSEVLRGDREPFPNFDPVRVDPEVERQRKIIKRETDQGTRPQIEQLESEGGPPIGER